MWQAVTALHVPPAHHQRKSVLRAIDTERQGSPPLGGAAQRASSGAGEVRKTINRKCARRRGARETAEMRALQEQVQEGTSNRSRGNGGKAIDEPASNPTKRLRIEPIVMATQGCLPNLSNAFERTMTKWAAKWTGICNGTTKLQDFTDSPRKSRMMQEEEEEEEEVEEEEEREEEEEEEMQVEDKALPPGKGEKKRMSLRVRRRNCRLLFLMAT